MSNFYVQKFQQNVYFSQSYCAPISLSSVCMAHMHAAARVQNQACGVRRIARWKYFHGCLTFTDGEYTWL